MEATGDLWRQRRRLATDSSADQRPEVEVERKRARWQHLAIGPHGQRREGTGRGDTAPAVGEGKASKGVAPARRAVVSAPAQNLANPMVGCRVQQTCKLASGEAVEVGRNDMDGPNPSGGTLGSKDELRLARVERLPVMSMEGRSLNEPHERSPVGPHDLRVGLLVRTARTGMRLRRRRDGRNCVARFRDTGGEALEKANDPLFSPHTHGLLRRRATVSPTPTPGRPPCLQWLPGS